MPHRVLACVAQRRVYWLLDPSSSLVLVHYLQLELPNSTADQQLPAAAACAPDGGKVIAIAPSLNENEARVPSAQRGSACPQAVPVPSPTSTLPLAFAKRAALAPRTGASAASSVLAMKPEPAAPLTPIVAASPELAICGGEFTLILVLATPIRDAGLVCVFGLEKVRRAQQHPPASPRGPTRCAPPSARTAEFQVPAVGTPWARTQYPRVPPGCVPLGTATGAGGTRGHGLVCIPLPASCAAACRRSDRLPRRRQGHPTHTGHAHRLHRPACSRRRLPRPRRVLQRAL